MFRHAVKARRPEVDAMVRGELGTQVGELIGDYFIPGNDLLLV